MSLKTWIFIIQQQENILLFLLYLVKKMFNYVFAQDGFIVIIYESDWFSSCAQIWIFCILLDLYPFMFVDKYMKKTEHFLLFRLIFFNMILTLHFCRFWSCKTWTNRNVSSDGFKQSLCCLNAATDLQTVALCLFSAGLRPPIRPPNTSPALSAVGSWASHFLYLLSSHSSRPSLYLGTFVWSQSSLVCRCHGARCGTAALFGGWLAAWHIVPSVLIECQAPFYVHFTPPASLSLSVSQLVYPRRPLAERENTQIGELLE